MSAPTFTIVLCTRNRAALLERVLGSVLEVDYPPTDVELVLIDNASTDGTASLVERVRPKAAFELRYVYETRLGLSAARNRAIREARGRYLFFTDDDQLVDRAVLREHQRVAERFGSRVQQGAIALTFDDERPSWLHGPLATMLGQTQDLPEGPANIDLYGGNMLFRREVFDETAAFREDLGKGAAGYSEDIEITRRLERLGERIVYAPSARIYHIIGPDRASPRFFRHNAFEKGWSDGLVHEQRSSLLGLAARTTVGVSGQAVLALLATVRADAHRSLVAQTRASNQLGRLLGGVQARRKR